MISPWVPLSLLTLGAALAFAWLWVRQILHSRRLERVISNANANLERLQRNFEHFVPGGVVEQLTSQAGGLKPERRVVTVLFADLRGFTSMCDRLDAPNTLSILNGYFQEMSEAISAHHGQVTEFMGDGLLALFGALEPNPWQARDAVLGALAMRAALARYNESLASQGRVTLRFGVGIHRGEVLAGVMGNRELSKFGVVGDPINVASRVEGLTRIHEVDLLITSEVREGLDARFQLRPMPATLVKGKTEPIVTYFVEGLAEPGTRGGNAGV